jgi:two-component system NtrC family sensor kinase
MKKLNCWEFKNCGREPGGINVTELGICPSASEEKADRINNGHNAGRVCWAVSGTFCQGEVQGSFACKLYRCTDCDFYKQIRTEEGFNFDIGTALLQEIYTPQQLTQIYEQLHYYLQNIQELQVQLVNNEKLASIGQLAAGIAHEINNPMAFISSNLNTLAKYMVTINDSMKMLSDLTKENTQNDYEILIKTSNELDEIINNKKLAFVLSDIGDILQESAEGISRVSDIIKNLKTISRVDEASNQDVNINECIEKSLELAKTSITDKCRIIKEFSALPLIRCQPADIEQAFANIINNAAFAVSDGGVITIKTEEDQKDIVITISDTGSGIPKEMLSKIFDPFFTTKPVGKGTGLGLSMSLKAIKNHGGNIGAMSEPGKGSTFTVRIPKTKS